ncbi:MAG: DnaJ C-terminal domain-containing protein [Myxococcota bacterium]
MSDFYQILGVAKKSDQDEIRRAYRRLARKYHPDLNPAAADQFKEITAAYDVLGNPDKRALYDEFGDICLKPGFDPVVARHAGLGQGRRPGGGGGSHQGAFAEFFQNINSDASTAGTRPYEGSARESDDARNAAGGNNPFFGGSTSGTRPYEGSAGERVDYSSFQGSTSGTRPYEGSAGERVDYSSFQGSTSGTTPYRGSADETGRRAPYSSRRHRPDRYYPGKQYGDGGRSTSPPQDAYRQRTTAAARGGNANRYHTPSPAQSAPPRPTHGPDSRFSFNGPMPVPGSDIKHEIEIGLLESLQGTSREILIRRMTPDGRMRQEQIRISIQGGVQSGEQVRLRGQGNSGRYGGPPGDLILMVQVNTPAHFRRDGYDLYLDVPITLLEALHGAKIDVPTPDGVVRVQIPRRASNGLRLRLRRRGVSVGNGQRGDLYLVLRPTPPDADNPEVRRLLGELEKHYSSRGVRADLKL